MQGEVAFGCRGGSFPTVSSSPSLTALRADITTLAVSHSIHVSDLTLPEGVKVLDNPKTPVVSVLGRLKEEAPAETLSPAAAATPTT